MRPDGSVGFALRSKFPPLERAGFSLGSAEIEGIHTGRRFMPVWGRAVGGALLPAFASEAAATPATAPIIRFRPGFIDIQRSAIEIGAVQGRDRFVTLSIV